MLGRDGLGSYYAAANLNPGYYLQLAAINDRVGALLLNSYGQPGGQESNDQNLWMAFGGVA